MRDKLTPFPRPKAGSALNLSRIMMERVVAIIDYGSGNLHSAEKAFQYVSSRLVSDWQIKSTNHADDLMRAEAIVLPGVGAFVDCMDGLGALDGMVEALRARLDAGVPFLGICVGMQLLFEKGREEKTSEGLGILSGEVRALEVGDEGALRVPHMGWNRLDLTHSGKRHALLQGLDAQDVYFAHSFCAKPDEEDLVCATSEYGGDLVACVAQDNICGVQFHPEKSQSVGMHLIANFLEWRP